MSSFIAIITNKYNMPQGLHQDQGIAPFQSDVAPFSCNTMYIMDDMGEFNGSTLVVPGSHKLLSEVRSGDALQNPLPPAINLVAPAGTVMIFEGRLLHGTGVNKSDAARMILVMNSIKPFMWNGDFLVNQRLALEKGEYVRVGQLSKDTPVEELSRRFTYRYSDTGLKQAAYQPEVHPDVEVATLEDNDIHWSKAVFSKDKRIDTARKTDNQPDQT